MSRHKITVPADCSTAQALAIVARTPRIWPSFAVFLARFGARKAGFYLARWRAGYRVAAVRRMAREAASREDDAPAPA